MNTFHAAPCQNHPAREALGICVSCRAQVCSECVTKVDGINYCVKCLAAMARGDENLSSTSTQMVAPLTWALVVTAGSILALMLWGMLAVAFPEAA